MSFRATSLVFMLAVLAVLAPVKSAPTIHLRHDMDDDVSASSTSVAASAPSTSSLGFVKQNALDAQKLNAQFQAIKETDSCTDGQMACVTSKFAQCVDGKWVLTPCAQPLSCYALPLVLKAGTSLVCDTQDDSAARFAAAGVQGGTSGTNSTSTPAAPSTSTSGADDDCDGDDGSDNQNGDDDDCDDTPSNTPSATPAAASLAPPSGSADIPATTTITTGDTFATLVAAKSLARRQLQITSSSSFAAVAATAIPPIVVVSSSTAPVTATPIPTGVAASATGGIVTPTVAIGSNGIVTVTVVSTVLVSATDCAATAAPTAVTVVPVVSSATVSPSTLVSDFPASQIPTSTVTVPVVLPSAVVPTAAVSSSVASASPTSTFSNPIHALTSGAAIPTTTPPATFTGTFSSIDIAVAITATI